MMVWDQEHAERGAAHLGRLDRGRPGLRDHVVPDAEPAPAARAPRGPARAPAGGGRRRGARRRRAGRRDPRRPARPGARAGHLRPGARRVAGAAAHGPGGPDARGLGVDGSSPTCPDAAVESFLALTGPGSGSTLLSAELRQLGGALARPAEGARARCRCCDGAGSCCSAVAVARRRSWPAARPRRRRALVDAMAPYSSGAGLPELRGVARSTYAARSRREVWQRLKGTRSALDPDGRLLANHPIPRLYENGLPTRVTRGNSSPGVTRPPRPLVGQDGSGDTLPGRIRDVRAAAWTAQGPTTLPPGRALRPLTGRNVRSRRLGGSEACVRADSVR